MNPSTKTRLRNFAGGKVNLYINMFNGILLYVMIGVSVLFAFLFIIGSAFSMWSKQPKRAENPLNVYSRMIEKEGQDKLHFESFDIKEEIVIYTVTTKVKIQSDLTIYERTNAGYIIDFFVDGEELWASENKTYFIPVGEYQLVIRLAISVVVDQYQQYTTFHILLNPEDKVTLSNEFRNLEVFRINRNEYLIYTKDSVGNYVSLIKRTWIYKVFKITFWVTAIYSLLNLIKIVIFYLMFKKIETIYNKNLGE